MTEEVPGQPAREPRITRSTLLTVLCILTFIGSGLNIISGLAIGTFFNDFVKVASDLAGTYKLPGMEMITEGSPRFFFVSALFCAGSVAGAYMMWGLKKAGFHVYAISQILLLIAPMYFYQLPGPSLPDIIFTGLFIILYSVNLRIMT
jgi:hypothetical protein